MLLALTEKIMVECVRDINQTIKWGSTPPALPHFDPILNYGTVPFITACCRRSKSTTLI